ncbi:MAG TPA: hypothetical protein VGR26_15090 [Acidimicrobiales bacterium]|nr:hypothetical protein [Acidimicrobiales bacterium]
MGAADEVRAEVAKAVHDRGKRDRRRDWRYPGAIAAVFFTGTVFLSLILTLRSNQQAEDAAQRAEREATALADEVHLARTEGVGRREILERLDALLLPAEGDPALTAPTFEELLGELRTAIAADSDRALALLGDEIEALARSLAATGADRNEDLVERIEALTAAIRAIPPPGAGPPGETGATGPQGPEGPAAPTTTTVPPTTTTTSPPPCETGTVVEGVGVLCEQEPQ